MAVKYQIFISSTFEDLKEERDAVIRAVLEMGHIPVGMEMFSAADDEQWQIIKRHIDESDYYVVIVAHRYGSLTDGISYTRKEFEYAASIGVPVLGFIIDSHAAWPADRVDTDSDTKKFLEEFKSLVRQRPIGTWGTAEELHTKSVIALMKAFTANPREGWVRGGSAPGPAVAAEISRLSAENAALRAAAIESASRAGADETRAMQELRSTLASVKHNLSYRLKGENEWRDLAKSTSLREIFDIVAPSLIPEYSVKEISGLIAFTLAGTHVDELRTEGESELADELEAKRSDIVPINHLKDVLAALMAFEVVAPSAIKHSVKDDQQYWSLTPLGIEFLKWSTRRAATVAPDDDVEGGDSPTLATDLEKSGTRTRAKAKSGG